MTADSLRVLVVLPMYGGSLPIGRYCARALEDLGHVAAVFDAPAFYGAFSALKDLRVAANRLDQLEGGFLQVMSQAILAQVETFEPDMVLALAQAPLSRQALRRLSRDGVTTAMWFVEDYKVFTYWRAFAPLYDVFAVIQKRPFLDELAEAGQQRALYLPMAALPSFHAPMEQSPARMRQYGADVAFVGAGYPNRRLAFRTLSHLDFKVWGTEWEGESLLARHVQKDGARVSPEECVAIYNASKINLNLHSSVQSREPVPQGDFVNPRTFELAAAGAFQLVDKRELMDELFPEGTLATFGDVQEMLERVEYFLPRPEERSALAAKARQIVLERHTYQHRMETLLAYVRSRVPGWPRPRREEEFPQDIPEDMRQPLRELLRELQLPAHAAFGDVLSRLRQRTGKLSDMETSLLFLDEWRKQYGK